VSSLTARADSAATPHDAIELLVEALGGEDPNLDRRGFYSRLAEGVGRLAGMRRVVVFRFDEVTRRVEAAGGYGVELDVFADLRVGLEAAPDAARALAEDTVVEVRPPEPHAIPAEFAQLVGDHPLVYVPMAAGGRWPGVIIAEPRVGSPPLDQARRELLWMLGKTLALASTARIATFHGERARELQQRIELARDVHERVVQRLFGVSMALSPPGGLDDQARERCAEQVAIALADLRSALKQPLGASPKPTQTTLAAELERLQKANDPRLVIDGPVPEVPRSLEPLVQSVLAEAVRNARKHSQARSLVVRVRRAEDLLILEIENDGVGDGRASGAPGVGLRLAALEAMQLGGILEFGERRSGVWQVRLAVADGQR
jgi:signal transduction histidine kinase